MAYGAKDFLIGQAYPDEAQGAINRQLFVCAGTAVAPVAAVPTTAAHLSLWNGELSGGKSYIIHTVAWMCTVSAAAAISINLLAQCGCGAETNPAGAAVIKGTSGQLYTGNGNGKVSMTIGNLGLWHPITAGLVDANTATIGLTVYQDLKGKYIVPPGFTFSLAGFCNAAGSATGIPYIIFSEAQLTLGN